MLDTATILHGNLPWSPHAIIDVVDSDSDSEGESEFSYEKENTKVVSISDDSRLVLIFVMHKKLFNNALQLNSFESYFNYVAKTHREQM